MRGAPIIFASQHIPFAQLASDHYTKRRSAAELGWAGGGDRRDHRHRHRTFRVAEALTWHGSRSPVGEGEAPPSRGRWLGGSLALPTGANTVRLEAGGDGMRRATIGWTRSQGADSHDARQSPTSH